MQSRTPDAQRRRAERAAVVKHGTIETIPHIVGPGGPHVWCGNYQPGDSFVFSRGQMTCVACKRAAKALLPALIEAAAKRRRMQRSRPRVQRLHG